MANLTADQAIERSKFHNEIVTIDYDADAAHILLSECDDNVEANGVTEYWANDPDSESAMLWRVHMRAAPAVFAVDDEFSNQITTGLDSYDAAKQVARRYLSAHDDAPAVRIYEDHKGGEGWDLTRAEVLS